MSLQSIGDAFPLLKHVFERAIQFAEKAAIPSGLSKDEAAAIHIYTMGSSFYRTLNATLRDPDRQKTKTFFGYLRLFLSGLQKLNAIKHTLWRGVSLNLRSQYQQVCPKYASDIISHLLDISKQNSYIWLIFMFSFSLVLLLFWFVFEFILSLSRFYYYDDSQIITCVECVLDWESRMFSLFLFCFKIFCQLSLLL